MPLRISLGREKDSVILLPFDLVIPEKKEEVMQSFFAFVGFVAIIVGVIVFIAWFVDWVRDKEKEEIIEGVIGAICLIILLLWFFCQCNS